MRLRTSEPSRPGIRRRRCGRGFRYLAPDGSALTDRGELERIRALVVPPAWEDVWICPWPNGHLQAVGTDAAGRRQYLYHPEFRRRQEESKHAHVLEVAAHLPKVRQYAQDALELPTLCRERVLGCAVRLLDLGFFRIGSDSYAKQNGSYGLTTLEREHVTCRRGLVEFDFPAKHGRHRMQTLTDPAACRTLRALLRRDGGGARLLAYRDGGGWHDLHGREVNEQLHELTGLDITAKDFRTWHATVLAAVGLAVSAPVAARSSASRRRG
ncbi:DNA topoisomerase IB, partial [Streptacidiphilus monticola]